MHRAVRDDRLWRHLPATMTISGGLGRWREA